MLASCLSLCCVICFEVRCALRWWPCPRDTPDIRLAGKSEATTTSQLHYRNEYSPLDDIKFTMASHNDKRIPTFIFNYPSHSTSSSIRQPRIHHPDLVDYNNFGTSLDEQPPTDHRFFSSKIRQYTHKPCAKDIRVASRPSFVPRCASSQPSTSPADASSPALPLPVSSHPGPYVQECIVVLSVPSSSMPKSLSTKV